MTMGTRVELLRLYGGPWVEAQVARIEAEVRSAAAVVAPGRQLVLQLGVGAGGGDGRASIAGSPVRVAESPTFRGAAGEVARLMERERPALLHCHGFAAALVGALARRRVRGPRPELVYEIHGARAFESWHENRHRADRALRFLALYALESAAILGADRLLLVTDEVARYYPAARLRRRAAIPRLVEPDLDGAGTLDAGFEAFGRFADAATAAGERIACYSGGIAAWQRLDDTLALLSELVAQGGYRAAVLTTHPEEVAARLQARGVEPGERWFVGRVERAHVLPALERCDCGILLREDLVLNRVASPTKLYEYVYAGLALVVSHGIPEGVRTVRETGAGVVLDLASLRRPARAAAAVRQALEKAYAHRGALRALRSQVTWAAGRRTLLELYGKEDGAQPAKHGAPAVDSAVAAGREALP
jgi:hypothetical protein